MDETTRRGLLQNIDAGITGAKAELDKLTTMRAWVIDLGNGRASVGTFGSEEERLSTADYIEQAFARAGSGAALTIPEIMKYAYEVGWTTTSDQPETIIRTTIGRMGQDRKIEATQPGAEGANEQRRYRLKGGRREPMEDR